MQAWYEDVSTIAFYGSLNLTLIFRTLAYFASIKLWDCPGYLEYFLKSMPFIAKDITMGCLICRVFDAVSMRSEGKKYPLLIRGTYIGLTIHVCVIYTWLLYESCDSTSNSAYFAYFVYGITMQSILSVEFIYALVLFFIMRNGMDEENRGNSMIYWLTIILSYMLFVIVCRVIYNILIISNATDNMSVEMFFLFQGIVNLLTELIPCILITAFLFILSRMEGVTNDSVAGPALVPPLFFLLCISQALYA